MSAAPSHAAAFDAAAFDAAALPTSLLFAPLADRAASPPSDLLAGRPEDLFTCATTGAFYTIATARLCVTARSTRHAKRFYCPVCVEAPLTLTTGADGVAHCDACGWRASHAGISSLSDLLARDAEPYPQLAAHRRALRLARSSRPAAALASSAAHASAAASTMSVASTSASVHSLPRRASAFSVGAAPHSSTSSLTSSTSGASGSREPHLTPHAFAVRQQQRDADVFAHFLPPASEPARFRHAPPHPFAPPLCGPDPVDAHAQLLPALQRVHATVVRKQECAPRRRLPLPRVAVACAAAPASAPPARADWEHWRVGDARPRGTAARVLPDLRCRLACCPGLWRCKEEGHGGAEEAIVYTHVRNHARRGVRVWLYGIRGEADGTDGMDATKEADVWLRGGESGVLAVRGCRAVFDADGMEARICGWRVDLVVCVRYDEGVDSGGDDGCGSGSSGGDDWVGRHEWRCHAFVRHARSAGCRTTGA